MKISIIMSTYNGEAYILQQLDSIRLQTVSIDEVLIFDDCSQDKTAKVITNYIKGYHLFNWKLTVNKRNLGWKSNFAHGLSFATGDIIFTSDQDDIWVKDKVERMTLAMINNSNIDLLVGDQIPFYFNNTPKTNRLFTYAVNSIELENRWKYILRPGCVFCFSKKLKNIFLKCWRENYAHDLLLWQLAALHHSLYHIDMDVIFFRRHDNNSTPVNNRSLEFRKKLCKQSILELVHLKKCLAEDSDDVKQNILNAIEFERYRFDFFNNKYPFTLAIKLLIKHGYYKSDKSWLVDIFCKIKYIFLNK